MTDDEIKECMIASHVFSVLASDLAINENKDAWAEAIEYSPDTDRLTTQKIRVETIKSLMGVDVKPIPGVSIETVETMFAARKTINKGQYNWLSIMSWSLVATVFIYILLSL